MQVFGSQLALTANGSGVLETLLWNRASARLQASIPGACAVCWLAVELQPQCTVGSGHGVVNASAVVMPTPGVQHNQLHPNSAGLCGMARSACAFHACALIPATACCTAAK